MTEAEKNERIKAVEEQITKLQIKRRLSKEVNRTWRKGES